MPRDWEEAFRGWARAASTTETEKQANAERMVCEAVDNYPPFHGRDIKIILQGSYRNNTNVRQESDVDVCVCCFDSIFTNFEHADYKLQDTGLVSPADYSYAEFKNDLERALRAKFKTGVARGDKAITIRENTYRVYADALPAFPYRAYQKQSFNMFTHALERPYIEPTGTGFVSDAGKRIHNWPEQHYSMGVAKNKTTGGRFKSIVRGLKSLKYEMEEKGNTEAKAIGSFLIESLTYNVPNDRFTGDAYYFNARQCLHFIYNQLKTAELWKEWEEVNGIKYLFHPAQAWTREQVQAWILAAWKYGEFS